MGRRAREERVTGTAGSAKDGEGGTAPQKGAICRRENGRGSGGTRKGGRGKEEEKREEGGEKGDE